MFCHPYLERSTLTNVHYVCGFVEPHQEKRQAQNMFLGLIREFRPICPQCDHERMIQRRPHALPVVYHFQFSLFKRFGANHSVKCLSGSKWSLQELGSSRVGTGTSPGCLQSLGLQLEFQAEVEAFPQDRWGLGACGALEGLETLTYCKWNG